MLKARSLAAALLGLVYVASSAVAQQPAAAAAASQLGRMTAPDVPLPDDWARELEDAQVPPSAFSYSFTDSPTPEPATLAPTSKPTTLAPTFAPTAAETAAFSATSTEAATALTTEVIESAPVVDAATDAPTKKPQKPHWTPSPTATPATIPAVAITLTLGGSESQQARTVQAIVGFLKSRLKLQSNVAILSTNTPAPGTPVDAGRRLSSALKQMARRQLQQSDLCAGPQVNATVTLEGYDDAEAVEAALEEVMSGAVSLPVDDSTSASDTICEAEAKLEMMAPSLPTEALDENGTGPSTEGNKQPSKTASIVIGAVVGSVGVMLILFVTIMAVKRRRNAAPVYPN